MCVLNRTHNRVMLPLPPTQDDEDRVPSTSKKLFTVALVSFGHYVGPFPCALRMGAFSYKGWIRGELCRHTSLP